MPLLIVNYHYVREHAQKRGIYPVTFDFFERQVEQLGQNFEFVSLENCLDLVESPQSHQSNYCLLTFDDGLKEQMWAFEFLKSRNIPAAFFVCSSPYVDGGMLAPHMLHQIMMKMEPEDIASALESDFGIQIPKYEFAKGETSSYSYGDFMLKRVKSLFNFQLSDRQKKNILDTLFRKVIGDVGAFLKGFYFNEAELDLLGSQGMLGAHTHSHLPLGTLSIQKMEEEIRQNVDFLEKYSSREISTISYPYGLGDAITDEVFAAAKNVGMKIGLTMQRGLNQLGDPDLSLGLLRVDTNDAYLGKTQLDWLK